MSPARRIPRILGPIVGSLVVLAVLVLGVFPTRTYLDQRRATANAEEQLRVLRTENAALDQRVARLHDDDEIERLAREQYNLVFPGEEAYALLPAPDSPAPADEADAGTGAGAAAQGSEQAGGHDRNLVERAIDTIAGLF